MSFSLRQGVERFIGNCPDISEDCSFAKSTLQRYRDNDLGPGCLNHEPDAWLFARMIQIYGPWHVIYNCLERVITTSEGWLGSKPQLADLLKFLGWKGSRSRFLTTCVSNPDDLSMFAGFPKRSISWKWRHLMGNVARAGFGV